MLLLNTSDMTDGVCLFSPPSRGTPLLMSTPLLFTENMLELSQGLLEILSVLKSARLILALLLAILLFLFWCVCVCVQGGYMLWF